MKSLLIITLFCLSFNLQAAFTLNSNTGKGFDTNNITIHVANTDCSNAGFSTTKYVSLIKSAVKRYWNNVPTSSLYLDVAGINTSIDISGDTHSTALTKVPANTILAGCNDSAQDFSDPSILGSAQMSCSGGNCKSVLILNAHANNTVKNKSEEDIESIIAHEIGHAFGLGHSSAKHNLMYFSISGKFQKWLGEDDIDGVTYLYPHDAELAGLLGSCATVDFNSENKEDGGGKGSFLTSLFLGVFMVILLWFRPRRSQNTL